MSQNNEKTPMREQPAEERKNNFKEVPLGYNKEEALQEAQRCLQCKHEPCVQGCPVEVPIPQFIEALKNDDLRRAAQIMFEKNNLPAICGRVCPQEEQCENNCVLGIKQEPVAIGRLERFVGDWVLEHKDELDFLSAPAEEETEELKKGDYRVAVVGSGPAGLTCAADLAALGVEVTIFEAFHKPGGVLSYGIPEFRLPKDIVAREIDGIKKRGVEIKKNKVIGKTLSVDDLFDLGYQAVFIGSGAGLPRFLNIPGENLNGVYSANEFLTRVNLMKAYKYPEYKTPVKIGNKIAVIGGGNVAMDSARTAKRLGADDVYIVYRRSEQEMPARNEEIEHAREEGIEFKLQNNPVAIHGQDGVVDSLECLQMELGPEDESGRRRPIPIEGSNWELKVDNVIVAIGQSPNPILTENTSGLETKSWGGLVIDDNYATTREGVFAGGDVVTGAATVIRAMGAGKKAARSIVEYIQKQD
ncbi:MAG: NADPH-dependent glutamate synthase [Bacillota bacterium]